MTTAEMLAEVETQIRKDIPRLMELREKCILSNKSNKDKFEIIGIDADFDEYVCLKNKKYVTSITFKNINLFEIIGHDIMLNDVLEWIRNCKRKIEFDYKTGYFLDEIDYYYSFSSNHHENAPIENKIWNLSYTYLKDQSEELIKFLYNLTKDK